VTAHAIGPGGDGAGSRPGSGWAGCGVSGGFGPGGAKSLYLRDPGDNLAELITAGF
jgi:hypothetical protein